MRLKRFDTSQIRVRSSGNGRRRIPGGRGGGIGIGTLIIIAIAYFIFGADPIETIGNLDDVQQTGGQYGGANGRLSEQEICSSSAYATEACNALQSLNQTWAGEFANAGVAFQDPFLDLYRNGQVTTDGCGSATSASGPFYCPADMGIYIDTGFYDILARQLGAAGDFARYYVIAHEYGHHIQNLTGLAAQLRQAQRANPQLANQLQVRMELQADCYAGVWAGKNRHLIEAGDMEEGLRAAAAIGDDRLQQGAGQRINPENFTHGTSAQRMQALRRGIEGTDIGRCDIYFN